LLAQLLPFGFNTNAGSLLFFFKGTYLRTEYLEHGSPANAGIVK